MALGTALVLVLVVGYFTYQRFSGPKYDIRKISGSVIGVEGNAVTVKGVYDFEGTLPEKLSGERDIILRVDSSTVFKSVKIFMPTKEELIASGKAKVEADGRYFAKYSPDELPRTEAAGSLEDITNLLKEGVRVKVEFLESIYNSRNPTASGVFYTVLVSPKTRQGTQ